MIAIFQCQLVLPFVLVVAVKDGLTVSPSSQCLVSVCQAIYESALSASTVGLQTGVNFAYV